MSPPPFNCTICAAPYGSEKIRWLREFRALYTNGWDWYQPHISGLSYLEDYEAYDTVLPEYDQRYDDPQPGEPTAIADFSTLGPHKDFSGRPHVTAPIVPSESPTPPMSVAGSPSGSTPPPLDVAESPSGTPDPPIGVADSPTNAPTPPVGFTDLSSFSPGTAMDFSGHSDDTTEEEDVWGYVCHASCWRLLEVACYPAEVNVEVLNGFCRSLSQIWYIGLDWGHDYGGIAKREPDKESLLVGEESQLVGLKETYYLPRGEHEREEECTHLNDPLKITELDSLLQETIADRRPAEVPSVSPISSPQLRIANQQLDMFLRLPPEIQQAILVYLPSRDVANLRLASRTVTSNGLSQTFWASRFEGTSDYSCIFEARRRLDAGRYRDWEALHKGCNEAMQSLGMRNRVRIWRVVRIMGELLDLYTGRALSGIPSWTMFDRKFPKDAGSWLSAGGLIIDDWYYHHTIHNGHRAFHIRIVELSSQVTKIYVSFVRFFDAHFVTGIRLVQCNGQDARLGYIMNQEKEVPLEICSSEVDGRNFNIHELRLAVSRRGIHAVAAVSSSGQTTNWAGDPQNHLRTRLRTESGWINALRGQFDGFKMTAIGIPKLSGSPPTKHPNNLRSLREVAQWHPDIPPDNLSLNEHQFILPEWGPISEPLHYLPFGGPNGTYLVHIVSVSVWVLDPGGEASRPMSIEFQYDKDIDGKCIHRLGPPGPYPRQERIAEQSYGDIQESRKVTFEVDGPGGERITAVNLGRRYPSELDPLSIQLNTNHGRSFTCLPESPDFPIMHMIRTEADTVITGFYASMLFEENHCFEGILNLGVITESRLRRKRSLSF